MAEQVWIPFRADKALKQEVTEIYWALKNNFLRKMAKGLPFEAALPEQAITRSEAKEAFYEL